MEVRSIGTVAYVASVSNRVTTRKLEQEQKKKVEGGGGGIFCSCPNFLDELARKPLLRRLLGRLNVILVKPATSPTLFPSPSAKTKKSNVTLRATRVQRQISYSGGHCRGRWGDQKVFIRSRVVSKKNFGGFS